MKWLTVAAIFLSGVSDGAAGELRVVDQVVPATMEAGSKNAIPLVVANDGESAWSPADGFAISYHWLDMVGETVVWDGLRSDLPAAVEPGAAAELVVTVEAPRMPGRYLLRWDVVHEGVRWISEGAVSLPKPVAVEVIAGHAFTVLEGSAPRLLIAGATTTVELVLQNTGSRDWTAGGDFAVAYHWLARTGGGVRSKGHDVYWDGRRTPFPGVVQSGESAEIRVIIEAPAQPGLWHLQWDLVEEGICWFSDRAPEPQPSAWVLVVPDPLGHGLWWSMLVLAAAAAAVSVWRHDGSGAAVSVFSVADLVWCVGAVSIKQGFVLAEAGTGPTFSGWLLIVAGASILALATRVLPVRFRGWACWIVVAGVTFVLWADAIYLRFFADLASWSAFAGVGQLGRVGASIRELLVPDDVWLWIDLLPGLVVVMVAGRLRRFVGERPARVAAAGLILAVAVGGLAAFRCVITQPSLLGQVFRRVAVAEHIGVLNLHVVDGVRSAARFVFSSEVDPEQFGELISWFRETAPQRAGSGPLFGVADGFNLVMVQVESLQTFVIGLEVGGKDVTPFLNSWAETGVWFSNVTDQTGQGRSSDSELSTQASLLPMAGGAAAFRFAGNDFTGMAEALSEGGYDTLSAVPYEGSFWNRRETHPAYGYSRSLFIEDFEAGERVGWGLSDRAFLGQASQILAAADSPFAAYLLTLSLHHPFEGFPTHLENLDVGEWEGTAFGNFLHTMHFFDSALAAFFSDLERLGLGDSTVIAVWGDHDAGFPWQPRIASAIGASHDAVGWYLSQEVPLLIRVPGVAQLRGERTVAAGHADIAPTLLALLGVDPAPYAFVGRNLFGDQGDRPVVGEYGCWRDSTKVFLQGDGSLEDGMCIELATMSPVDSSICREGHDAAARTEHVSTLVLEHDLQRAIHRELAGEVEAVQ